MHYNHYSIELEYSCDSRVRSIQHDWLSGTSPVDSAEEYFSWRETDDFLCQFFTKFGGYQTEFAGRLATVDIWAKGSVHPEYTRFFEKLNFYFPKGAGTICTPQEDLPTAFELLQDSFWRLREATLEEAIICGGDIQRQLLLEQASGR